MEKFIPLVITFGFLILLSIIGSIYQNIRNTIFEYLEKPVVYIPVTIIAIVVFIYYADSTGENKK